MAIIDDYARGKLAGLDAQSLRRTLTPTDRHDSVHANRDGKPLISFCCNDYLNLSHHPEVMEAANQATMRFGTGAGGSRLISGNVPLYEALETKLAQIKGTEAALVFGSGYLTNIGVIPCFAGPGDLIIADALSHACLHGGARMSGADIHLFAHNDMAECQELLAQHRANARHCMIVTDGVFSMDGDLALLVDLANLAEEFDAWLMVDDAHGLGVIGDGKGSVHAAGLKGRVPLQMGTLSKSVGTYGGYLCASQDIIDLVINRGRSFVYSTGLPPATLAASIKALAIIDRDRELTELPIKNAARFCTALNLAKPQSPVVPLILGEADQVMRASAALQDAGYLVTGIRPPTVPEGTARLRFTFTAAHTPEDIDGLVDTLRELGIRP